MAEITPPAVTRPAPSFSFSYKVVGPPVMSAPVGPAAVVSTMLPFATVRHLLSDKPLARPSGRIRREPPDLAPIVVSRARDGSRVLELRPPLTLTPEAEGEGNDTILFASHPELNIRVYASARDELAREVESHLFFLWEEYAKADPRSLDPIAARLAERLRGRITESPDGEGQA